MVCLCHYEQISTLYNRQNGQNTNNCAKIIDDDDGNTNTNFNTMNGVEFYDHQSYQIEHNIHKPMEQRGTGAHIKHHSAHVSKPTVRDKISNKSINTNINHSSRGNNCITNNKNGSKRSIVAKTSQLNHKATLNNYVEYKITKNLKYKCNICGKTILTKSGIVSHAKSHLGIKKYQCKFCGSRFVGKTARDRHELIHTGVKPWQCTICQRRFRVKSILVTHQITHTKEKNYHCKICNKKYAQLSSLRRHEKAKH